MIKIMIKKKLKVGLTKSLTKLSNNSTANKEDSNSFAIQLFSKKEMLHSTSAQPAYGIPILMVQLLFMLETILPVAIMKYTFLRFRQSTRMAAESMIPVPSAITSWISAEKCV